MTRCIKAAAALAVSLGVASDGVVGQTVYRCEIDGQVIFSQQPCAEDAETLELESTQPVGPAGAGIIFQRTTCHARATGTPEAIVELMNNTNERKTGELRVHFTYRSQIIDVGRRQFDLPPWRSESFAILGPPRRTVDRCEYRYSINR
jgi:hypothetical protein